MELEPDPRMLRFYVGLGRDGRPATMSLASLGAKAAEWPVAATTPLNIAEQLRVARDLYVHSLFVQEFATVGVAWALHAVEGALRLALGAGKRVSFETLVDRAQVSSLIDEELRERLDAGRKLRNHFSHPASQEVWTPALAARALETSHMVVHRLFASAPDSADAPREGL